MNKFFLSILILYTNVINHSMSKGIFHGKAVTFDKKLTKTFCKILRLAYILKAFPKIIKNWSRLGSCYTKAVTYLLSYYIH